MRLRISSKDSMQKLIALVNGNIRYPTRIEQFKKICFHFNIPYIEPETLDFTNAYLSGLFDSDGTICFSVSKTTANNSQLKGEKGKITKLQNSRGYHQLKLSITSKNKKFLDMIQSNYGFGKVYTQNRNRATKHPNMLYHWVCQKTEDIDSFVRYFDSYPPQSVKKKRVFLIPKYLKLKKLQAHLSQEEVLQKSWFIFCHKWFS